MNNQFGFDFGDNNDSTLIVNPIGTWTSPRFTIQNYRDIFSKAQDRLLMIAGAGRPLFRLGLESAVSQLEAMMNHRQIEDDEQFTLWRMKVEADDQEVKSFIEQCTNMPESPFPLFEYKIRHRSTTTTYGMFVEDLGSIIVRIWNQNDIGVDFYPWRDSFFLESYSDTIERHSLSYSIFGVAYCADKIAYSNDGVASVPTFTFKGRQYINTGGLSHGKYSECNGWSFCRFEDWKGETFSYQTQSEACDDGRIERGDRRGLVVRIRGQLCVINGVANFFDANAGMIEYPDDEESTQERAEYDEPEEIDG